MNAAPSPDPHGRPPVLARSRRRALLASIGAAVLLGAPAAIAKASLDTSRLVIGATSSGPQRNGLWSCQTSFSGGGATAQGSWFNGDGTWDKSKKLTVDGSVRWPNANLSITLQGSTRIIKGNALPLTSTTGTYPIARTDDVYAYDRNPGAISAQTVSLTLPASPTPGAAQCVGGEVGISVDGPPIFNAVDAGGRDAVAWEAQDSCSGHPQQSGVYHYHGLPACAKPDGLVGWALDGFPIWGPIDPSTGEYLDNDALDECHGTTSTITVDGAPANTYHYVANDQYPYTVGCFRSAPAARQVAGGGSGAAGAVPSASRTASTTASKSAPTTASKSAPTTASKPVTTAAVRPTPPPRGRRPAPRPPMPGRP